MKLIKNVTSNEVILTNNNIELMKLKFVADEFCWNIYTNEKINFTRDLDCDFYDALEKIMSNEYKFAFPETLTYKQNNKLCWYSDSYGDIEDVQVTNRSSRLNIELEGDIFKIWAEKPMYKLSNFTTYHCVVFSPGGNGQGAININSGSNFQDEVVKYLFLNILYPEYNHIKVKTK